MARFHVITRSYAQLYIWFLSFLFFQVKVAIVNYFAIAKNIAFAKVADIVKVL